MLDWGIYDQCWRSPQRPNNSRRKELPFSMTGFAHIQLCSSQIAYACVHQSSNEIVSQLADVTHISLCMFFCSFFLKESNRIPHAKKESHMQKNKDAWVTSHKVNTHKWVLKNIAVEVKGKSFHTSNQDNEMMNHLCCISACLTYLIDLAPSVLFFWLNFWTF